MNQTPTILIADRNPHVRELIRRELVADGYRVWLAKSARELVDLVLQFEDLDLVILDPDLPDTEAMALLKKLNDRLPPLPVIVLTYASDTLNGIHAFRTLRLIEKSGASIGKIRAVLEEILGDKSKRPSDQQSRSPREKF